MLLSSSGQRVLCVLRTPRSLQHYLRKPRNANNLHVHQEMNRYRKCEITHTHTELLLLAIKKKDTLPFATTQINFEGIMQGEISQTEKDKHCMGSLLCAI